MNDSRGPAPLGAGSTRTPPAAPGPVHWDDVDTPVGRLLVAVTDRGVLRVGLPNEDDDELLGALAQACGTAPERSAHRTSGAADELREYFDGERERFDLPLDLRTSSRFRERVQRAMLTIGYGRTVSYAELAGMAGASPSAARAAGGACAHNPVPILVPCHRVLPSGGGVGNYRGGAAMKRWLLDLEQRHGR